MRHTLLISFLTVTLAVLANAQSKPLENNSEHQALSEPKLPVVDEKACPFEGCTFREWTVIKVSPVYSSWQADRKKIGDLKLGEKVLGLTGVHITWKPDRIVLKENMPALSVQPGDIILRYMYVGEGFADIWVKGKWHKEYDCSFVTESSGSGCSKNCSAVVAEDGIKEWWVKVKRVDGQIGWVLAEDNFSGMDSLAKVFLSPNN